jgi:peptidoglycan/LPS O-acetylase OafA/YrhL
MLQKSRLQNNYDFLRVLAALCITFGHSFSLLKQGKYEILMLASNKVLNFSFIGLSIFFSISGYLIAKSAATSTSFKSYLWKRVLRIQPLLILVCVLSVFILGPIFTSLSLKSYFTNINTYTYFRNIIPLFGIQFQLPNVFSFNIGEAGVNGSLWTLIVEERLYLIVGMLVLLKGKKQTNFLYLVAILNIVYLIHHCSFNSNLLNYLKGRHVFYALIFLNASCFYILKIDFTKQLNKYILPLTIILLLVIANYFSFNESMQVLLIPFFINAIAHIKAPTNYVGKYGDFTYGIYIFSFPVQQILVASKFVKDNPYVLFIYTFIIVFPLAILSWHLLEKKMLLLKSRVV